MSLTTDQTAAAAHRTATEIGTSCCHLLRHPNNLRLRRAVRTSAPTPHSRGHYPSTLLAEQYSLKRPLQPPRLPEADPVPMAPDLLCRPFHRLAPADRRRPWGLATLVDPSQRTRFPELEGVPW